MDERDVNPDGTYADSLPDEDTLEVKVEDHNPAIDDGYPSFALEHPFPDSCIFS